MKTKEKFLIAILIISTIIWAVISYSNSGVFYHLLQNNTDAIIESISSFGYFASIIFVLIVILEVVLAPIPPLVLYIVAGALFGGFYGGVLVLCGNIIGALIDFKIARHFIGKKLDKKVDGKMKLTFDKYFNKYGTLSIFLLRINPLTTSDIVSYLAGLTNIKTSRFLIATALGLTPLVFIQSYFGNIIIDQSPIITNIVLLISIIYLIIFIYLLFIALFKKKTA